MPAKPEQEIIPPGETGLSLREQKFVDLVAEGMKLTQARQKAGFKPGTSLDRIMSNPAVVSALTSVVDNRLKSLSFPALTALEQLLTQKKDMQARVKAVGLVLSASRESGRGSGPGVTIQINLGEK